MDLIITILPVVTKDLPISPRFTPYNFLSRCKFSTLTTRQPMVEFYLLALPRFPLRKKEHKSYFGKTRTHDFCTSRCAAYLLDQSGDEQLEKDMAEIRDGRMKDVLVKLRLLSDEIEEINRRFGTVNRTDNRYESDLADLRRQVERGSTPLPPQNQQAGTFPIPMYSGERNSLSRFLKQFHTWALSSRSEDALNNSRSVILTRDKTRRELEIEYGRQIVAQSLTVWNGLTKLSKKISRLQKSWYEPKLHQRHGIY